MLLRPKSGKLYILWQFTPESKILNQFTEWKNWFLSKLLESSSKLKFKEKLVIWSKGTGTETKCFPVVNKSKIDPRAIEKGEVRIKFYLH